MIASSVRMVADKNSTKLASKSTIEGRIPGKRKGFETIV